MSKRPQEEKFTPEETQKRFEAALHGAQIAGHKPREGVPQPNKNKAAAKMAAKKKAATTPKSRRRRVSAKP